MKNYTLILAVAILISGCGTTSSTFSDRMPSDAIIGHWKNALNEYADHYFSHDGRYTTISPIKDYFIGTYDVVKQDADKRLLELKIVDKIPGSEMVHRRRIVGTFSEDYKTFSGESLYASRMPFSYEYIDDQQFVIDAEAQQVMKYLQETKENLATTRKNLTALEKDIDDFKKSYHSTDQSQQTQIEKLEQQINTLEKQIDEMSQAQLTGLQGQINELREQLKNVHASSIQEDAQDTPNVGENETQIIPG